MLGRRAKYPVLARYRHRRRRRAPGCAWPRRARCLLALGRRWRGSRTGAGHRSGALGGGTWPGRRGGRGGPPRRAPGVRTGLSRAGRVARALTNAGPARVPARRGRGGWRSCSRWSSPARRRGWRRSRLSASSPAGPARAGGSVRFRRSVTPSATAPRLRLAGHRRPALGRPACGPLRPSADQVDAYHRLPREARVPKRLPIPVAGLVQSAEPPVGLEVVAAEVGLEAFGVLSLRGRAAPFAARRGGRGDASA